MEKLTEEERERILKETECAFADRSISVGAYIYYFKEGYIAGATAELLRSKSLLSEKDAQIDKLKSMLENVKTECEKAEDYRGLGNDYTSGKIFMSRYIIDLIEKP